MQKLLILTLLLGVFHFSAAAQAPAKPETSDPEAKKVLDKARKKYEAYKTMEATFSLTLEMPGQPKEVQKGTIAQDGDKFRLDMDQQTIISDGKTTWVYLKKNNEVQINNADPGDMGDNGFLTPKELLRRYQKGDYIYAITEKSTEGGKALTHIEFKPKDKKSDISKMRVSIEEKTNSIVSVKAFAKDSGKFTFKIATFVPNKKFVANHFTFNKDKYPGVKVEDLR